MEHDWKIIESGSLSPVAIMAKDAALLAQLEPDGPSLLHFYDWNVPCLTYGYFIQPSQYLHLEILQNYELQMARRPTGGGIIFHLSDLAFSILIPALHPNLSLNTLDNYAWVNQKVAEAIVDFTACSWVPQLFTQSPFSCQPATCPSFCMAKATPYDLIIQGKKVGGAAQRRTKQGLLHQGSLSLLFPPVALLIKVLKDQKNILTAMQNNSFCLLPEHTSLKELQEARNALRICLKKHLLG